MAPCRQLLMWSVPSIAVLLGIFWFRKKREFAKSDPGGREKLKSLQEELAEALNIEVQMMKESPLGKVEMSIVKSTPIDIVASGCGSQRSSPLTDEEVDLEIDKIILKKSLEKKKLSLSLIDKHYNRDIEMINNVCIDNDSTITKTVNVMATFDSNSYESLKNCNGHELVKNSSHEINDTNILTVGSQSPSSNNNSINENIVANIVEIEELNSNEVETICESNRFSNPQPRLISERDSANHSPVEQMLASPSMCHFSDSQSEGSSDSGKGCSEAASPPPANLNLLTPGESSLRIHQFIISQTLVGLLIGKHGSFVTLIKNKTGASVYVRRHPDSMKQKICAVEGTPSEVDAALEMIKEKFPEKRFSNFSTEEISAELYQRLVPFVPEFLQLQLVESVNNETIMTCLVSAGHFFLQQPLHPTFPSLHALHRLMASTYQKPEVPPLPRPIKEGTICAAPTENNWYRAQVISTSEENDTSVVKLVDFGGYLTVDNDQLKQIRSDFMTLPFQATEALLAFVKPANNETEWSGEALRIMAGLTAGQLLHAQVAGYDEAGIPLVHLYLTIGAQQIIFLNSELVERGLAEWDLPIES